LQNIEDCCFLKPHIRMGIDQAQLKEAKKLITELLHEKKPHPVLIRLAWHDSGTYDKVSSRQPMAHRRHNGFLPPAD